MCNLRLTLMHVFDKEHYDLMSNFERNFKHLNLERETKDMWELKYIYCNGETNKLFIAYRMGYMLGKTQI